MPRFSTLAQMVKNYSCCVQDTVTGFLLAGVGNIDLRRKGNFLVVNESTPIDFLQPPGLVGHFCVYQVSAGLMRAQMSTREAPLLQRQP